MPKAEKQSAINNRPLLLKAEAEKKAAIDRVIKLLLLLLLLLMVQHLLMHVRILQIVDSYATLEKDDLDSRHAQVLQAIKASVSVACSLHKTKKDYLSFMRSLVKQQDNIEKSRQRKIQRDAKKEEAQMRKDEYKKRLENGLSPSDPAVLRTIGFEKVSCFSLFVWPRLPSEMACKPMDMMFQFVLICCCCCC